MTTYQGREADAADPDALSKYGPRWRSKVLARAKQIMLELDSASNIAESPSSEKFGPADLGAARDCVIRAMKLADKTGLRARMRNAVSGHDTEEAWRLLHDAEQAVVMGADAEVVRPTLPQVRATLLATMPVSDARLALYLKVLDGAEADLDGHRRQIRAIQSAIFDAAESAYDRDRTIRNWIAAVAVATSCVLAGIAIASQTSPDVLQVCQAAARLARQCAGAVTAGQLLAGSIGGLLMVSPSLLGLVTRLPGPVGLPAWQALLRAPTGAAAGLLGGIIVQSGLVSLFVPQHRTTLLAYAGLFGVAAAAFMRPLDRSLAGLRRVRAAPDVSQADAIPGVLDSSVRSAVRAAFAGPALVNFDGWLGVTVAGPGGQRTTIAENNEVRLLPGVRYSLTAQISTSRPAGRADLLQITGGADEPIAEFSVVLDSDDQRIRRPPESLSVRTRGGSATASFDVELAASEPTPWLWIRVGQRDRVIQHLELIVTSGNPATS